VDIPFDKVIEAAFIMGGSFTVVKWRMDRFEKDFEKTEKELWGQIESLRKRYHDFMKDWFEHQKESAQVRLELAGQITDLRVSGAKTDERFKAIEDKFDAVLKAIGDLKIELRGNGK
jgi:hypothetical protein